MSDVIQKKKLAKALTKIEKCSLGKWYTGRTDGKTEEVVLMEDVERIILELLNEPTTKNDLGVASELDKNSKKLEKDFGESDCISRQATVKRLCNLAEFMNEHKENSGAPYIMAALFIQDNKTEFPSVTPQEPKIGHCKNCKFFELNSWAACGGIPIIVAHEICKAWGEGCKTKEDGYCFLFEPQESEDKK